METRKSFPNDELHFEADQHLQESFENGEYILMSCSLSKYNQREKCQERALLITSKAIYNINKYDPLAQMISFFKSNYAVRRRISIEKVAAITVSESSDEFVIHVKDEFDYRYSSPQKDKIIAMILKAYEMSVKKPLTFFYVQNLNLHEFTTREDDVRAGIIRVPSDDPILMERKQFLRKVGIQVTLDDFDLQIKLNGGFNNAMVVEEKDTKQIYVLHSISTVDYPEEANIEKYVLEQSQSPWIVPLEFIIQNDEKLFFGTKHLKGGDLFFNLRVDKRFSEERVKFYAAEIILGLEYLHGIGTLYRNLRPEKVLMDEEGHICLRDFSMSKRLQLGQRTNSISETLPDYYFSPEMVKGEEYGYTVDWWTLGNVVFEMLIGLPPFFQRNLDKSKMFDAILGQEPKFHPKIHVTQDAKDFILQLLQKDPEKRLGSKEGAEEVKKHKWFADIDWELLAHKKVVPPFKPQPHSNCCDCEYEEPIPMITSANQALLEKFDREFGI